MFFFVKRRRDLSKQSYLKLPVNTTHVAIVTQAIDWQCSNHPQSFVARNSLLASVSLRFSPAAPLVRVLNFIAQCRCNIF